MKKVEFPNKYGMLQYNMSDCFEAWPKDSHFSISKQTYTKIVKEFLKIYVYELMFLPYPIYFFFGGRIMKNRIPESVKNCKSKTGENVLISKVERIGYLWFERPFKFFDDVKLTKTAGSSSSLIAVEKKWRETNSASSLFDLKHIFEIDNREFIKDRRKT